MIYFFTGAGMAADSGLPIFRASDGLWEKHDINLVCNFERYRPDASVRQLTREFYNARKRQYGNAQPHAGYAAIAQLQQKTPVTVITTNIDLLHEKAGTQDVIHLHGRVDQMSCAACLHYWHIGDQAFQADDCPACGSGITKPGIVFFGEPAPEYETLYQIASDLTKDDIFIVVGTSLNVVDPIHLIRSMQRLPRIVMIDPNIPDSARQYGVECIPAPALQGVCDWIAALEANRD
ncbi:SIR2 family NAD-dependent protein deacylase [Chitinibacter tainanensis]|uniref:SIR2 family NAD-dependent protein deacylase n=1 Tax=Chitinibacter tainanensis TaxID=230667 RepID=UPI00040A08EC|nr:Sir2 family NAD-dependent protein deacetylase [Chitinibacter tainanensis]